MAPTPTSKQTDSETPRACYTLPDSLIDSDDCASAGKFARDMIYTGAPGISRSSSFLPSSWTHEAPASDSSSRKDFQSGRLDYAGDRTRALASPDKVDKVDNVDELGVQKFDCPGPPSHSAQTTLKRLRECYSQSIALQPSPKRPLELHETASLSDTSIEGRSVDSQDVVEDTFNRDYEGDVIMMDAA